MKLLANTLTGLVAVSHLGFLTLEMFFFALPHHCWFDKLFAILNFDSEVIALPTG